MNAPNHDSQADGHDGIGPISYENIRRLGVGQDGYLYWDGRRVETTSRIGLTFWQKLGAIIVVCGALGGVSQGMDAGHNFGCKLHLWSLGCARP